MTETHSDRFTKQVDSVRGKLESLTNVLNEIRTDVAVIKKTCQLRGETCAKHVEEMDKSLRGNGKGLVARLGILEKRDLRKDKFAYTVIGALASGAFALLIALVMQLLKD